MEDDEASLQHLSLQQSRHGRRIPVSNSTTKNTNTIITTLSLYSHECITHLQAALHILEERDRNQMNQMTGLLPQPLPQSASRFKTDISDSENDDHDDENSTESPNAHHNDDSNDSDEHSNQDSDHFNEEESDTLLAITEKSPLSPSTTTTAITTTTTNNINNATTTNNTTKPPKVSEFHPSLIRKHINTISTISFPIPNTTTTTTSSSDPNQHHHHIEFPTALLSKELQQQIILSDDNSTGTTEQCRAYHDLAMSIQPPPSQPIIILLIRSGRFAGAVFQPNHHHHQNPNQKKNHQHPAMHCTHHRTSVRYTVRKGQGKAQSAQDNQGRKAISIGSQLRRQGEVQLREDIRQTILDWKESLQSAALILISVPRTMQKDLFDHDNNHLLPRRDPRIRRIPLDFGRPTFENVCLIYQVFMTVTIREYHPSNRSTTNNHNNTNMMQSNNDSQLVSKVIEDDEVNNVNDDQKEEDVIVPLSAIHIAAQNGDVATLESLLDAHDENEASTPDDIAISTLIDQPAGSEQMTPLHYAAASISHHLYHHHNDNNLSLGVVDPNHAASCVRLLLERGHANPCIMDQRRRVPYSLVATQNDKVRDAFRISRAILGEDYCDWDNDAKVGTPLSLDALNDKLEKEAEKRRKKRLKQKEKKAREKAEEQAAEERRLALEEQRKKEEDAKRIRDGLQPKISTTPGGKACDFCQTICVGKKRINMFKRLDYSYCTSECLQNHKRELMAAAAMARMNAVSSN